VRLSAAEARRIALAAQGFADGRPARPGGHALRRVLKQVGLLQIDSVNVLARGHYLTLFGRLGPYPLELVDKAAWYAPRRLFEYWGHEASLLPVGLWPLMQWRMQRAERDAWAGIRAIARDRPDLVERMLEAVRERGPVTASSLSEDLPRAQREMWAWSDAKRALEWLFWTGRITSARRLTNFERAYDVPERVLPRAVLSAGSVGRDAAQRELLRISARALGVATETDLRDYFRLPATDAKARLAELAEAGDVLPVAVEGWRPPAYLDPAARVPRRVQARALLAPFDPLIWERARTERIFGLRYRIEIYVPAEQRVHGYYVLPFLLGDRLVARVDLKADRAAGVLRVQAAHLEPGAPAATAGELAAELELMASWLGLGGVVHAQLS
jgi:uncharacterized protein